MFNYKMTIGSIMLLFLVQCQFKNQKNIIEEIESTWKNELNSRVEVKELKVTNEQIDLALFVHSPSLIDSRSIQKMLSIFCFEMRYEFYDKKINILYVNEEFENDSEFFQFSKKYIIKNIELYKENPKLYHLIKYSIQHFSFKEIITLSEIIPQINQASKGKIQLTGDFWDILKSTSESKIDLSIFQQYISMAQIDAVGISNHHLDELFRIAEN